VSKGPTVRVAPCIEALEQLDRLPREYPPCGCIPRVPHATHPTVAVRVEAEDGAVATEAIVAAPIVHLTCCDTVVTLLLHCCYTVAAPIVHLTYKENSEHLPKQI
jgi:hypothetical protein